MPSGNDEGLLVRHGLVGGRGRPRSESDYVRWQRPMQLWQLDNIERFDQTLRRESVDDARPFTSVLEALGRAR